MAYTLAVGDIVQVTVSYFQANIVQMMNTFHYRLAAPATLPDGAAAITEFLEFSFGEATSSQWPNAWAGLSGADVAVSEVRGQRIFPIRNVPVAQPRSIAGISIGDTFPGPVQWSISESGDFAGKGRVGGVRIPGLTQTAVVDSRLTAAFQTAAVTLTSFLETAKTPPGATWQPIIFNRLAPATSQDVTNATIQPEVRTQRTRVSLRGI